MLLLCICSCGSHQKSNTFWDELGADKEDIDEVWLVYRDQKVRLEEQTMNDFLQTISEAKPSEVEDNHEFTPSDYTVIFSADGHEYPVIFYWFPYVVQLSYERTQVMNEYLKTDQDYLKPIGDRFDAVMQGKKYHFRFSEERKWTESLMRDVYDRCAKNQGLLTRMEQDGGDHWQEVPLDPASPIFEDYPLSRILEESDRVLLCTFEREIIDGRWDRSRRTDYLFRVDEVLKGEMQKSWYVMNGYPTPRTVYSWKGNDSDVIIYYANFYNPEYQKGKQYLICIAETDIDDDYFAQYGTAILDGDTLFPRFNTEQHPFYNVKLEDVREYLEK